MNDYLKIFIDGEYPIFIDKYLNTKTLNRLKHVTQFCGCDYTKLYQPLFLFTRFDHSLVVAHMTWHFTKDKKETIAALLHDVGTPCFAHTIDYVFNDYLKQESSEKVVHEVIKEDEELLKYLREDNIEIIDLENMNKYFILENKAPKLCTDRLDGVFHTCYIWLHTHKLEEIKELYNDMLVLINEEGNKEIGFKNQTVSEKFIQLVFIYAKELRGNTDKYVMKFISEIVKIAFKQNLICLSDLYILKEKEIVDIFSTNFYSWTLFNNADIIIKSEKEPSQFYVSLDTKKRNTIPLVKTFDGNKRITDISNYAKAIYGKLDAFDDSKFAYVEKIKKL